MRTVTLNEEWYGYTEEITGADGKDDIIGQGNIYLLGFLLKGISAFRMLKNVLCSVHETVKNACSPI